MEYFKFDVNLMTLVALVLAFIAIAIKYYLYKESLSLNKNTELILYEVILLTILFVVVPFVLVSHSRTVKNGFKFTNWWRLIGISTIITILIIVVKYFYEKNKGNSNYFKEFNYQNSDKFRTLIHIIARADCEVIFYAIFFKMVMGRSFGLIPAVIITAIVYSFYLTNGKYTSQSIKIIIMSFFLFAAFQSTLNWLILFPIFWLFLHWQYYDWIKVDVTQTSMNWKRVLVLLIPVSLLVINQAINMIPLHIKLFKWK